MSRWSSYLAGLLVLLHLTSAEAVSFGIDGEPVVYQTQGKLCFRVERYVYSHSIISFLSRSRSVDDRDVRLAGLTVGSGDGYWGISQEDTASPRMRLRKTTEVCYGDVPPGYVLSGAVAQPLMAGRHDVTIDASIGGTSLRFYRWFCLADDGALVSCDAGEKPRPSFFEQLFGWIFSR